MNLLAGNPLTVGDDFVEFSGFVFAAAAGAGFCWCHGHAVEVG